MKQANRLEGKVIVITGASSGVGRAAALAFARQGANVVVAARRKERLDEVVAECKELGSDALAVTTDVTDAGQMNTLAAMAQHWGGKIDVWINNAGLLAAGSFDETPISVHEKVIATNLMGYINGAHAVLPHFKAQGYGVLINNISVGGWFPTPYAVGYSASKYGLRGFGEALQGELHHYPHIHVCNLYPAFLDTPGIQHAANFTGKIIRPAPPIYDPQRIAKAMTRLALAPRNNISLTGFSSFLRMAHAVFPGLSRLITANVIELYLHHADDIPFTSGNVLETVDYGTSIHGGWGMQPKTKRKLLGAVVSVAGLAIGLALLAASKRSVS